MSLIGDALRKARKEAAERESHHRGVLFSAKINDSPNRSHLGLGLALGALIAVSATVVGGGAVWWLLSSGERAESAVATSSAIDAPVGEASPTPTTLPSAPEAELQTVPAVSTTPTPTTATSNRSDLGAGRGDEQPTTAKDPIPTAAPVGLDTVNGFTGIEGGDEVFVMEADLGAVHLSLDFIVSKADDPFAEINGVELHLGGVVEGYRVKAIESDRVRLSNGRRTIVLRAP